MQATKKWERRAKAYLSERVIIKPVDKQIITMSNILGDDFLLTSKQNYLDKITPSKKISRSMDGYSKIVNIAKEYFAKGKCEEFAAFFQEGNISFLFGLHTCWLNMVFLALIY